MSEAEPVNKLPRATLVTPQFQSLDRSSPGLKILLQPRVEVSCAFPADFVLDRYVWAPSLPVLRCQLFSQSECDLAPDSRQFRTTDRKRHAVPQGSQPGNAGSYRPQPGGYVRNEGGKCLDLGCRQIVEHRQMSFEKIPFGRKVRSTQQVEVVLGHFLQLSCKNKRATVVLRKQIGCLPDP